MTDESHDPGNPYSAIARETSAAAAAGGVADAEAPMSGWGQADDSTWTEMGDEEPAPGTLGGRGRRPSSYGLPPITQRTSDLRAAIGDVLTTKAPTPLVRLANRVTDHAEVDVNMEAISDVEPVDPDGSEGSESPAGEPSVPAAPSPIQKLTTLSSERPELVLGAAFLGGLLLATIIKRLVRR